MAKKEFETIGVITLRTPLLVNGAPRKSLSYNFELLTADDIITADKNRIEDTDMVALVPSSDHATQLQIFALAVSKADPDIDYSDIKRMSGWDALKAASIAKGFFTAATGEDEDEKKTAGDAEKATTGQNTPTCPEHEAERFADGAEPTSEQQSPNSAWSTM